MKKLVYIWLLLIWWIAIMFRRGSIYKDFLLERVWIEFYWFKFWKFVGPLEALHRKEVLWQSLLRSSIDTTITSRNLFSIQCTAKFVLKSGFYITRELLRHLTFLWKQGTSVLCPIEIWKLNFIHWKGLLATELHYLFAAFTNLRHLHFVPELIILLVLPYFSQSKKHPQLIDRLWLLLFEVNVFEVAALVFSYYWLLIYVFEGFKVIFIFFYNLDSEDRIIMFYFSLFIIILQTTHGSFIVIKRLLINSISIIVNGEASNVRFLNSLYDFDLFQGIKVNHWCVIRFILSWTVLKVIAGILFGIKGIVFIIGNHFIIVQ